MISLVAWLTALWTSARSTRETMSKVFCLAIAQGYQESAGAVGRLPVLRFDPEPSKLLLGLEPNKSALNS
jgi:hypothetical protein